MVGEGPGQGYNINVPWEHGRCGDADYLAVWDHVLIPVAEAYNPDIVMISAGFDAGSSSILYRLKFLLSSLIYLLPIHLLSLKLCCVKYIFQYNKKVT